MTMPTATLSRLTTPAAPVLEPRPLANRLIWAFFAVAVLGWTASALLSAIHFWVLPIPEGVPTRGPMAVMTSPWAYVGPVPLATIGAVYYIGMMAAAAMWLYTKNPLLEKVLLPVTASGVAFSAYFVYLQLGVIGEICPFCMVSAAATTALFVIELVVKRMGGAVTAPPVNPALAWPVMVAVPLVMALVAMFSLTVLPLPGR
ncbi:vitamin K epoxide reductase family protein [Cellulomonas bogoriensis]|uniref:Vitamin K epoxide reductase n=1 Tax=Cellulomonas bogoriensis 69B4 = DSM 16987 TaxID=1386082 RepID=A0A0A0BNW1_9CELL|nr:vitamin K epoxide reductase family protein [Cellulomonas bogoriensis]KGM09640.1 vitamin K epoxide reductase [Cellulomonas bogoriensis 69B4 = DSM 16987]